MMTGRKVRVALVGCGQIADAHLQEARKVAGAEVVAVCDRHLVLAQQAAARFRVPATFNDLGHMLEQSRPDVLHIATPPRSHLPLARQALAAGVHVYLEKPFTVGVAEADELLRAARSSGRLVCVGHDQLFDPMWQELRQRHRRGEFGRVVHVDAVLGYDLAGSFGKVLASDPDHWVHGLPGGLFHNTISHIVYKITDFLTDERPRIWATWFSDPAASPFPSDLRVMFQGGEVTANLLFLSQARPAQRVTRVYGTRQGAEVDLDGQLIRRYQATTLPGPFAKLQAPYRHLREAVRNLRRNCFRFLRSDLHYFAGMHRLFGLFYQAIREGGEPPIPYAEIRRVTAIMDDIFRVCREGAGGKMESPSCTCGDGEVERERVHRAV
jgi:predicted dehydrogenase